MTKSGEEKRVTRPHGTGSIYPLAGGGYKVQVEAGWNANGTRRYIRRNIRETGRIGQKKANAKLKELLREHAPEEGVSAVTTVKSWSDKWLEITVHDVRPSAWVVDRSAIRRWIVPTIGHKRLDKLTPADVRAVRRAILDAGLSAATAQRYHGTLVTMLRAAVLEGHRVPSRIFQVGAPEPGESERPEIPLDKALAILAVASTRKDASIWVAALLNGMRPAEVRGLTWACVDLDKDEIDISWQLKSLPYKVHRDRSSGFRIPDKYVARQLVNSYHLVRPKTEKGQRTIPIVPWLHDALVKWKLESKRNDHDLVWPGQFGRPMFDKHHRAAWAALCAAAEVGEWDLYSCRHTTVTLLREAGVPDEVIQAIVGHASKRSRRPYTHVQRTETLRALGKVAEKLKLTTAAEPNGAPETPPAAA